jgi:kexin
MLIRMLHDRRVRWLIFRTFLLAFTCGSLQAAGRASAEAAQTPLDTWLIQVADGVDAAELARSIGAFHVGPLDGVDGYHRVRFARPLQSRPDGPDWSDQVARALSARREIVAFEPERMVELFPRDLVPEDPRFPDQWHLENVGQRGGVRFSDSNVRPAWASGLSGSGVVVAIVDQGVEYTHPDLAANWLPGSGRDYRDSDNDAAPTSDDENHGTAVAGITAAVLNDIGVVGVAHGARFIPLRLIGTPGNRSIQSGRIAEALSHRRQEVAVYNNSWGPSDDAGVRYADIEQVTQSALAGNIAAGRGGLGNIYVWAAGNGGLTGDNSNYDAYNASPYTLSVGALGQDDIKAGYSEPGANLLVVAPSGGRGAGILTTDNSGGDGYAAGDYYDNFSGTSAAAPIVAGVAALLLEARPDLGWRDVQQILALTAAPVDMDSGGWVRNGAGHWVSHDYGFGRVDAAAAVALARTWPVLGPGRTLRAASVEPSAALSRGQPLERQLFINEAATVQHVRVTVNLTHSDWGDLQVEIESPQGTRSLLAEPHANANRSGDPGSWTYLSTRHLGEPASGSWTLRVTDDGDGGTGRLDSWSLEIRGVSVGVADNRPPVAEDLFIESTRFPVVIDALNGITDPDGDPLELIGIQQPRWGDLSLLGDGQFRFTMGRTRDGGDRFSLLVSDGRGGVVRRMVHILDPRPVARNDLYTLTSGQSAALPVLVNDLDPDGDPLRLNRLAGAVAGEVAIEDGARIRYAAPDGFTGVERIQYFITDDSDGSADGWATVIVQPTPDIALEFDGEDDFVRMADAPQLQLSDRFTAEAWIYPEDWGEYVTGFGRIYDRDTFVFFLNGFDHAFYNDRSLVAYFILEDGSAVAVNSDQGTIELDRWQHVAVQFDSGDATQPVRLFVDGEAVGVGYPLEGTSAPRQPVSDNRDKPLYMGEAPSGARAFQGRMTEFRVWNAAIGAAAIAARHDQRLAGNEPGLQVYLRFDQTLEPEAISRGSLPLVAEISGASRVPLQLPWEELLRRYTMVEDAGNGWWRERTLGWIHGDRFPWVYLPGLEWAYSGQSGESNRFLFYPAAAGWGWIATSPEAFPWFYTYDSGGWIRPGSAPAN